MGGGGSAQQSQSSQGSGWSKIVMPEELKPLYKQSADYLLQLQNLIPLWGTSTTTAKPGTTPAYPATTQTLAQSPQAQPAAQPGIPTEGIGGYFERPAEQGPGRSWSLAESGSPAVSGQNQYMWYDQASGQSAPYTPGGGPPSWFPYVPPAEGQSATPQATQQPTADTSGLVPIKNPDGTVSYYRPEDVVTQETSPNFLQGNPMQIAPVNALQSWAAARSPEVWNTPESEGQAQLYATLAPLLAGRMATGAGVGTDPAVLAASEAFERLLAPGIQNQMGLAGLGKSSSLANALALGKTAHMLPLIQDYISREQQTLANQASMYGSMVPQLAGLGSAETARRLQAINAAATQGATLRGAAQEPLTAQYQDFLRRQALAEQALFVPFGATATASIGPESQWTQTSSGSGSQSSGMFK